MQQHHRIALAGNEIVQLDPVDVGKLALRRLRERGGRVKQHGGNCHQRDGEDGTRDSQAARHFDFLIRR
jgi:hypothetical protein